MRLHRAFSGGLAGLTLVAIAIPISTSALESQTGHTYVPLGGGQWCITDVADSVEVLLERVIVKIPPDSMLTEAKLDAAGFTTTNVVTGDIDLGIYVLSTPDTSMAFQHLDSLETWPLIDWAVMDLRLDYYTASDDSLLDQQWYLADDTTDVYSAWQLRRDLDNVEVMILDSGVNLSHPDLAYISGEAVTVAQGYWDQDAVGHGTAVASVCGALRNNSQGMAGIAGNWSGDTASKFYMFKFGGTAGQSETATVAEMLQGLRQVHDRVTANPNKLYVLNISSGIPGIGDIPTELSGAVDRLVSDDVVIVVATGNGASRFCLPFPASHPDVVAVSGYDRNFQHVGQHATGTGVHHVDVLAPAVQILAANAATGGYFAQSGTSLAAPIVTGIAALVRTANPHLTALEVRDVLRHSASKLSGMDGEYVDNQHGYGAVNAFKAIIGATYDAEVLRGAVTGAKTVPDPGSTFDDAYLWGDVTVEDAATLTLPAGTTAFVPATDSRNVGTDTSKVELVVRDGGTLSLIGGATSKITFQSNYGGSAEASWFGINVHTGGTIHLANGVVKNAVYGVALSCPDTAYVTNTAFSYNQNCDIKIGGAGAHLAVKVEANAFTVGGGTGIEVFDAQSGGIIKDNALIGSSATSNGIYVGSIGSASPVVTGNTVEDVTTGKAIYIAGSGSTPILTKNTFKDSKYGVYVDGADPVLGDPNDSSSDNVIQGNSTTGLYVSGGGAAPTVRNNQITGNYNGVVGVSNGNPDLGTTAADGNNTISGNTNYCLWNRTTGGGAPTIQACGNWWGSDDPPGCTSGSVSACNWLHYVPAANGVAVEPVTQGERSLSVGSVSPVPMRTHVSVHVTINAPGRIRVEVYDLMGRLVSSIAEGPYDRGQYRFDWDGSKVGGGQVASGTYYVRATHNGAVEAHAKVVVVR